MFASLLTAFDSSQQNIDLSSEIMFSPTVQPWPVVSSYSSLYSVIVLQSFTPLFDSYNTNWIDWSGDIPYSESITIRTEYR